MPDTFRGEYLQEKNYSSTFRAVGLSMLLLSCVGCASSRIYPQNQKALEDKEEYKHHNPIWAIMHDSLFGDPSDALQERR